MLINGARRVVQIIDSRDGTYGARYAVPSDATVKRKTIPLLIVLQLLISIVWCFQRVLRRLKSQLVVVC